MRYNAFRKLYEEEEKEKDVEEKSTISGVDRINFIIFELEQKVKYWFKNGKLSVFELVNLRQDNVGMAKSLKFDFSGTELIWVVNATANLTEKNIVDEMEVEIRVYNNDFTLLKVYSAIIKLEDFTEELIIKKMKEMKKEIEKYIEPSNKDITDNNDDLADDIY